jgi:hypothetical protein
MGSRAIDIGNGLTTLLLGLEDEVKALQALLPLRGLGEDHKDELQQLEMKICAAGERRETYGHRLLCPSTTFTFPIGCVLCAEADVMRCRSELTKEAQTLAELRALQREATAAVAALDTMEEGLPTHLPGRSMTPPTQPNRLREVCPNLLAPSVGAEMHPVAAPRQGKQVRVAGRSADALA